MVISKKSNEKTPSIEVGKELDLVEIMSLQLELDDEQLTEWREKRSEINMKNKK